MGQCVTKLSNLFEETEPAPHSYKASIRAKETAKATHKGNLLLTDTEILFYENKKVFVIFTLIKHLSKKFYDSFAFFIYFIIHPYCFRDNLLVDTRTLTVLGTISLWIVDTRIRTVLRVISL